MGQLPLVPEPPRAKLRLDRPLYRKLRESEQDRLPGRQVPAQVQLERVQASAWVQPERLVLE